MAGKFNIFRCWPRAAEGAGWRYAQIAPALAILGLISVGCTKPPSWEFDELDISRSQMLNEVSLGQYEIPIPISRDLSDTRAPQRNRLRFNFDLHAVVAPEEVSRVTHSWERHEGMVRDQVIQVCRNASLAELQEPELSTLKARLMDALGAHLGEQAIRRLLMTEVATQEL